MDVARRTTNGVLATDWTSATQSPVVSKPSGVADGDILVMFVVTNTTTNFASPIAGWTRAGSEVDTGTDCTTAVYWKVASGEGASWTMTNLFDSTEVGRAVVVAYTGGDPTSPLNAVNQNTFVAATSVAGPSVTPTLPGCMIIQCVGTDPGTGAYAGTPDTSPTASEAFDGKDANSNAYVFIQDYLQATPSPIALDATGLTSDGYGGHQIAIAPRHKTLTEALTLAHATLRVVGIGLVGTLVATDAIAGRALTKTFTEAVTLTDATVETDHTGGGGGSYTKDLTETLTLGDQTLKIRGIGLAGAITPADTLSPREITKTPVEALTLTDPAVGLDYTGSAGEYTKDLSDGLTLGDVLSRELARAFIETASLDDAVQKGTARTAQEQLGLGNGVPATWPAHANYSSAGATLTRTAVDGSAGVVQAGIRGGLAWIEFTATQANALAGAGLSYDDPDDDPDAIDFMIRLQSNGVASVYENGSFVATLGPSYAPGDVFRVEYQPRPPVGETGGVRYLKNGTPLRVSLVTTSLPLRVCGWVYDQGASIGSVRTGVADSLEVGSARIATEGATLADTLATVHARGLELTETIALGDLTLREVARTITEAVMLSDNIQSSAAGATTLTETATLADTLTRGAERTLAEAATVSDTLTREAARTFLEGLTLGDDLDAGVQGLDRSEAVTLADTLTRELARTLVEGLTLEDSELKVRGLGLAGAVATVDTLARDLSTTPTETLTLGDSLTTFSEGALDLTEALTLTDLLSTGDGSLDLTEALTLADSELKVRGITFANALTLAGTFKEPVALVKSEALTLEDQEMVVGRDFEETLVLEDTLQTAGAEALVLTEGLTLTDARQVAASRVLAEAVHLEDTLQTAEAWTLTLTEGLSLADTRQVAGTRELLEAVDLEDTLQTAEAGALSLVEVVTLTDARQSAAGRTLEETLVLEDAARRLDVARTLGEALGVSDNLQTSATGQLNLSEALTLTDTRQVAASRALSEALSLADDRTAVRTFVLAPEETLTLADTRQVAAARTLQEALNLADSILTQEQGSVVLTEGLSLTDTRQVAGTRALAEGLSLGDVLELHRQANATWVEVAHLDDRRELGPGKTLADGVALADAAVEAQHAHGRTLTDALTLSDERSTAITRELFEGFSLADSLVTQEAGSIVFAEGVVLGDVLTHERAGELEFTEALTLTDERAGAAITRTLDEQLQLLATAWGLTAWNPTARPGASVYRTSLTASRVTSLLTASRCTTRVRRGDA